MSAGITIFSQKAFHTFEQCPLKFRYVYRDGLAWLREDHFRKNSAQWAKRGRDFHLMAERYFSRLPLEKFPSAFPEGQKWLTSLREFLPLREEEIYFPEHQVISEGEISLVATFDLVRLHGGRITLYDWKVGERPLKPHVLRKNWQTIVYLVVAEKESMRYFGIEPKGLSLVYWNPVIPDSPVTLTPTSASIKKYQYRIHEIASQCKDVLDGGEVPPNTDHCPMCSYRYCCTGEPVGEEIFEQDEVSRDDEIQWDEITEIPF